MRSWHLSRGVAAAVVSLALVAPAALAARPLTGPTPSPAPISSAPAGPSGVTATLSTARPGARPVVLSLVVRVPLVCGRPLGPTTVTLPAAAHVPATIAAGAVTVNTLPVAKVAVTGSTVAFGSPPQKGIMCHSVTEGIMRVVFTRAAGLGNPARAGTYAVSVRHGLQAQHGSIAIR